ncbi:MAG: hypothetical protein ACLPKE_06350 [Streptosporangiaceae bacterium]
MATGESGDAKASDIFAAVIDRELDQERERTTSLEQRAVAVITSSGVLVSLVFGFGALIKGQENPHLPLAARILLALALAAFVLAAVVSLLTNRPRAYKPLGVRDDLQRMVADFWSISADHARRSIAEFRVGEVDRWRDNNKLKASDLQRAIAMECCGIGLLAASIIITLV